MASRFKIVEGAKLYNINIEGEGSLNEEEKLELLTLYTEGVNNNKPTKVAGHPNILKQLNEAGFGKFLEIGPHPES